MFISSLFLFFIFPVAVYAQSDEATSKDSGAFIAIIILIIVGLILLNLIFHYRCPKCKKWWVMRQEKKELLNTDIEIESRKEEIKDNLGNVLRVEEVEVPVLVHHYEIWRKCKRCGHLVKRLQDEREEKYSRTHVNE